MNTLTRAQAKLNMDRDVWLAKNKGVLRRIASEFSVSAAFMTDIFRDRRNSRSGDIERRLAELGAPGFSEKQAA